MRLLLGIGGNDDGFDALATTLERVRETGDELTVAVLEHPDVDTPPAEVEAAVRDRLANAAVTANVRTLSGEPGPALVELAETEGFDRIVLGGGRRSPMGKLTVGPVGEFVVLNSTVSVTLVR
jgi:nucleotide-binding universal stress UspA family protein